MTRSTLTHQCACTPPADHLVNEQQVAERTGLSAGTLRNWRSRRVGPSFVKLRGGAIRYSSNGIDQWIDESAVVTTEAGR
ncbi:MAG: helix-turn-helix domain-containing protein [Actinomycetota bacterium]|nr:helix-turn-helix domain-containing protein [Actinomycetota bacterium]